MSEISYKGISGFILEGCPYTPQESSVYLEYMPKSTSTLATFSSTLSVGHSVMEIIRFFLSIEMRPPSRKGQPVVVEFSIYVVDVNSINVEDMDFR